MSCIRIFSRLRRSRGCAGLHLAAAVPHRDEPPGVADVQQRIRGEDQEVGALSRLDRPPIRCAQKRRASLHRPLRRALLVADEDVAKLEPGPPAFLWLVDITDEKKPVPFASFRPCFLEARSRDPAQMEPQATVICGRERITRLRLDKSSLRCMRGQGNGPALSSISAARLVS